MNGFDETHRGATFRRFDFREAVFDDTYLSGVRIRNADLRGAVIRGSMVVDVTIDGEVGNLVVNGVDVTAFVEQELDRRDPDRALMRPQSVVELRSAWDILERRWDETVARARRLEAVDPGLLHERVDGEWSFTETLRHLVFATDAWICRALLGDPTPWSPLDLPHDDMADAEGVPRDRSARPDLDTVLALRRDRMDTMREAIEGVTDEQLAGTTDPVPGPGYPESQAFPVGEVLATIVNEEWHHHVYANRDLAVLESRAGLTPQN